MVTFPHIFVFMALLPASTKPHRPDFAMLFPHVFDASSRVIPIWVVASLMAISLRCKGFQGLSIWVVRTILAGPHGMVWMTTLGGVEAATIGAVECTMSLTAATGALRFWMGLPLTGAVVLPVAPAGWPALIVIGAPFYLKFSVLCVNELDTWPSTVTCLPPLSALSGT